MNESKRVYSRVCWLDLGGEFQHSRWYPGSAATEQAKFACEIRWPDMKFWIEKAQNTAMPELTIQDLIG